jgi:ribosomal protein L7/L12
MDDAQLAHRFALLEAQVKLLSDQLGMPCPPFASTASSGSAVPAEVVELVRAGKKIQAISELRRLTGASLVEAKDIVESL